MTVVESHKDPQALTLTIKAEFTATPDKVWEVWADPRKLERWWGPPTWPATFTSHDFVPGGRAQYYMTGPEGEKAHGWWEFVAIDAPTGLAFDDGFADQSGTPQDDGLVTRAVVQLDGAFPGTLMTITSTFPSAQAMEQLVSMGMEDGIREALGQVDAILAED